MNNYTNPYYNPYAQQQPQNVYAYCNGIESAKAYQVSPNQTVLLIDSDSPHIYMKVANAMGQSTIQCFDIKQVTESDVKNPVNENFEALVKRVEALESRLPVTAEVVK